MLLVDLGRSIFFAFEFRGASYTMPQNKSDAAPDRASLRALIDKVAFRSGSLTAPLNPYIFCAPIFRDVTGKTLFLRHCRTARPIDAVT